MMAGLLIGAYGRFQVFAFGNTCFTTMYNLAFESIKKSNIFIVPRPEDNFVKALPYYAETLALALNTAQTGIVCVSQLKFTNVTGFYMEYMTPEQREKEEQRRAAKASEIEQEAAEILEQDGSEEDAEIDEEDFEEVEAAPCAEDDEECETEEFDPAAAVQAMMSEQMPAIY